MIEPQSLISTRTADTVPPSQAVLASNTHAEDANLPQLPPSPDLRLRGGARKKKRKPKKPKKKSGKEEADPGPSPIVVDPDDAPISARPRAAVTVVRPRASASFSELKLGQIITIDRPNIDLAGVHAEIRGFLWDDLPVYMRIGRPVPMVVVSYDAGSGRVRDFRA